MAPAKARTTPPGGSAPVWLRLERKTVETDGLTLEFVAAATRSGHGQRPDQLVELLAAGDLVRIRIRLDGPVTIDVQTSLGGLGTPATEEQSLGPPEDSAPPSPAEGEVNEERQVAITQELAPLEPGGGEEGESPPPEPPPDGEQGVMPAGAAPATCACGCGGELVRNDRGGLARFLRGHGTRLRTHEQRLQAAAKAGATQRGYERSITDPARVAELRDQIAAGKYQTFATLRKAVVR